MESSSLMLLRSAVKTACRGARALITTRGRPAMIAFLPESYDASGK